MKSARQFLLECEDMLILEKIASVRTELFGSLAMTGREHSTDQAIMMGLEGETPEAIKPSDVASRSATILENGKLNLLGRYPVPFIDGEHLVFHKDDRLPHHSNGMRFTALSGDGEVLQSREYYSVGGGFVIQGDEMNNASHSAETRQLYPFRNSEELLQQCEHFGWSISRLMCENEFSRYNEAELNAGLLNIWEVMKQCVENGLNAPGEFLPGGLNVRRRAPKLYEDLKISEDSSPSLMMDWVSLYAMAVNEVNASGGRVVTAPTNGAAGVIPAVMHYCMRYHDDFNEQKVCDFLLTAAGIGILYKEGASLSAAEVGCQGEIGVACSMAAAGLTAKVQTYPRSTSPDKVPAVCACNQLLVALITVDAAVCAVQLSGVE